MDPAAPGMIAVQLPAATSGEDDEMAELFLLAGPWFPARSHGSRQPGWWRRRLPIASGVLLAG